MTVPHPSTGVPVEVNVKRKGTQVGSISRRGGRWIGYYSRWAVDASGVFGWHKTSQSLGEVATTSRAAAKRKLAALVAEPNRLAKSPGALGTLGQFVAEQFEQWVGEKSARGQEHYRYVLDRHILPSLGNVSLDSINTPVLQGFIAGRRAATQKDGKPYSAQTIHHIAGALSAIFSHMERVGLWDRRNPASKLVLPKLVNAERIALTQEQVELVIGALVRQGDDLTALLVRTLAWTGLRIGEAVALRWSRVNLQDGPVMCGSIAVPPRALVVMASFSHGCWSEGKTGTRIVPMVDRLASELAKHKAGSAWNGDEQFVFSARTGKPVDEHNCLARHLKPALAAAGLPASIAWHDFRHSFETWLHAAGASMQQQMAALGHSSPRMTARYTHVDPTAVRAILER